MRAFNKYYLDWQRIKQLTNMSYKPILDKLKLSSNTNFIGQGYTKSITPNLITNHFLENPKVYTPYTPYQSEISQGRLELLHNYQTMISEICKQDISVSSMLNTGQTSMDLVSISSTFNKSKTIYVHENLNQSVLNCMTTRATHQNMDIIKFKDVEDINIDDANSIFIQNPDSIGNILNNNLFNDVPNTIPKIILTDLMPIIHYDIDTHNYDFCFGNGGSFGIPMGYGGPQPAFLSSKIEHIRKLPGKIVGKSIDKHELDSYRLALQTREQHIKREKATSNICTNQALLANMSVAWYMYHGRDNVKEIANDIYEKTLYLKNSVRGDMLNDTFFDTLSFSSDIYNQNDLNKLCEDGFSVFKNPLKNHISITIDETHTYDDIDRLIDYLKPTNYFSLVYKFKGPVPLPKPLRDSDYCHQDIFNDYNQEQKLARYLYSLEKKDFSLLDGMIPLGSCTMKYNSPESMKDIVNPIYNCHPFEPIEKTPYGPIINNVSKKLKELSGFDEIFYGSQSGAMGEYAGLTTMINYMKDNGFPNKKIILLPDSCHGTNSASSVLAGLEIKNLKTNKEGDIDLEAFDSIMDEYGDDVIGAMITFPSTLGIFEDNIEYIINKIHDHNGLVYMDGANFNAILGNIIPSELGFDLCHFNLHKTFCIPHGGGGPGMGPIGVTNKLKPYLPQFNPFTNSQSISTNKYGSSVLLNIVNHYLSNMSIHDLKATATYNIENTRYIISELEKNYKIMYTNKKRAHEFIIDTSSFKSQNILEQDIAKRLIDYGFHPPTMSWPIKNSLMIEVTETETIDEIDRFILAMNMIFEEIWAFPEILKNAPHTIKDITQWNYDYSIEKACFPLGNSQKENKFWPSRNRINDIYGDKNIIKR